MVKPLRRKGGNPVIKFKKRSDKLQLFGCLIDMKKIIFMLTAAVAALMLSSCNMITGSGITEVYSFDETGFQSVDVSSACKLTVTEGPEYSVLITCDDNIEYYLDVRNTDGVLSIGLVPFTACSRFTFNAVVTMPELKSVTASGASSAYIYGFDFTEAPSIDLSGASSGKLELFSAVNLNAAVSGASKLDVVSGGTAGIINLNCSGASTADIDYGLVAGAVVNISGASRASINSAGFVSGSVTGASGLTCFGGPDTSGLYLDITSMLHTN